MPRGFRNVARGTPPLNVDANRLAAFFTTVAVNPTVTEMRKVLRQFRGHLDDFIQQMADARANLAQIPDQSARQRLRRQLARIERDHRVRFREQMRRRVSLDVSSYLKHADVAPLMERAFDANWSLIKTIPPQAAQQLQRQLGYMATFDRQKVIQAIDRTRTVTWRRARLIARDQNNKLVGQLSQVRQTGVGIKQYEWITSQDERVRPSHRELQGEVFDWDNPPVVGHPGEDIQCRCHASPVWPAGAFAQPQPAIRPPPPPPPPVDTNKAFISTEKAKIRALMRATPAGVGRRQSLQVRLNDVRNAPTRGAGMSDADIVEAIKFAEKHERRKWQLTVRDGRDIEGFGDIMSRKYYREGWSYEKKSLTESLWNLKLTVAERRRVNNPNWKTNLAKAEAKVVQPDLDTMIDQTEMLLKAATDPDDIARFEGRLDGLAELRLHDAAHHGRLARYAASKTPNYYDVDDLLGATDNVVTQITRNTLTVKEARIVGKPNWRTVLQQRIDDAAEAKAKAKAAAEAARKKAAAEAAAIRARGTKARRSRLKGIDARHAGVADPDAAPVTWRSAAVKRAVRGIRRGWGTLGDYIGKSVHRLQRTFGSSVDMKAYRGVPAWLRIEAERVRLELIINAGGDGDRAIRILRDLRQVAGPEKSRDIFASVRGLRKTEPGHNRAAWNDLLDEGLEDVARVFDWDVLESALDGVEFHNRNIRSGYAGWARRHAPSPAGTPDPPEISFRTRTQKSTVSHEIGHHIEFKFRGQKWETPESARPSARAFAHMLAGKSQQEIEGIFFYRGYGAKTYFRDNKIEATELLTVGMEQFVDKNKVIDFAYKSPEWFRFVYIAARGGFSKALPDPS